MTKNAISVYIDGELKLITFTEDKDRTSRIIEYVNNGDATGLLDFVDKKNAIRNFSKNELEIKNGSVYYNDTILKGVAVDRLLKSLELGLDYQPLSRFIERSMQNPDPNSLDLFYNFLEYTNLPITNEGKVYCYKAVTWDYKDLRTKSFDNSVGVTNEMSRDKVDANPDNGCSFGFHVGTYEYAKSLLTPSNQKDRIVICEIDPADVVCVPKDLSFQKVRTCRYKVIGEFKTKLPDVQINEHESEEMIHNLVKKEIEFTEILDSDTSGELYVDNIDEDIITSKVKKKKKKKKNRKNLESDDSSTPCI